MCARLDNLPLAVELAAARSRVLAPAQMLDRLAQRLDLLKGGRDMDPRQQTLRATIEWSHDLLGPDEQGLFARLAIFAGGCTLEAAEQVVDADLDTLQSLVDKSLVRATNRRYWMLETIREYAVERLEESGEGDRLQRRHAEFFLVLVEEVEFNSTISAMPAHALYAQGLDAEAEEFAHESKRLASSDDVFSQAMWRTALAKVRARRGDAGRAERLAREAVEMLPAAMLPVRSDSTPDLAVVLGLNGRASEAKAAADEAARLYEQKGNLVGLENARRLGGEPSNTTLPTSRRA